MGSDRHRCCGRAAYGHLLFLYNKKMLLQEEEKQEREEGQGWLQHEKHARWRGMMNCSCVQKHHPGRISDVLLFMTHVAKF